MTWIVIELCIFYLKVVALNWLNNVHYFSSKIELASVAAVVVVVESTKCDTNGLSIDCLCALGCELFTQFRKTFARPVDEDDKPLFPALLWAAAPADAKNRRASSLLLIEKQSVLFWIVKWWRPREIFFCRLAGRGKRDKFCSTSSNGGGDGTREGLRDVRSRKIDYSWSGAVGRRVVLWMRLQ